MRYERQTRLPQIGEAGQARLAASRALVVGCGALGSVVADTLARAGVGNLRLVDRDFLEWNNLQRQVLYDEADVASGLPKAVCAANKLREINSEIGVEPIVADVDSSNVCQLIDGVDVILDGTDNFEIRFLLNDVSLKFGVPWVYGGCLGASGQTMTILPGTSACLRCLYPEPPPTGSTETCDTAGIVAPIIHVIASWQALEAIKILVGDTESVSRALMVFEMWENRVRQIGLEALEPFRNCPCAGTEFPWLDGRRGSRSAVLCGRNAVQISHAAPDAINLESVEAKVRGIGPTSRNRYLLRLQVAPYQITLFADGRAIVQGTEDAAEARSVLAKYIGA